MIDIKTVREKYASMPDGELVTLVKNEGHQLTTEGIELLHAELQRRKLDIAFTEDIENDQAKTPETHDHFNSASLMYVFDQIENGKSIAAIMEGLLEFGLEEPAATKLLLTIDAIAKQRLKKAELELLIGTAILSSGIAITFLPLSMPANRLTYIIACCTIIYGALKFVKGIYNKGRFKKVIRNIPPEI